MNDISQFDMSDATELTEARDAPAAEPEGLAKLRAPFAPHQISKLPKPFKRDAQKGRCLPRSKGGNAPDDQDCFCGGYHGLPALHLDYVGHAALTDRLLDTDPNWSWEPMALADTGLPLFDQSGGLWIKLTVLGVTRPGYGSADGKRGGDAVKEIIGDALRNAAMRFGAALDLWHKGDLHGNGPDSPAPEHDDTEPRSKQQSRQDGGDRDGTRQQGQSRGGMSDASWAKLCNLLKATNTQAGVLLDYFNVRDLRQLNKKQYDEAINRLEYDLDAMARQQGNNRGNSQQNNRQQGGNQQRRAGSGDFDPNDLPPF